MKKTKFIATLIALTIMLSALMPITTVFAVTGYTITFSATGTHTVTNENGNLKIDGQIVTLEGPASADIGYQSVSNGVQIVVSSTTVGTLNYNANEKFTLYNTDGHVKHNMSDTFNSSVVFNVEDYDSGSGSGSNPPPVSSNYTVDFGSTHSYTIGTATVTATVAGATDYTNVTLEDNTVITLSDNFDPDTMEVEISNGGFHTTLTVNNDKTTKISNRTNEGGLPSGVLTFVVKAKSQGGQGGGSGEQQNPEYSNINVAYTFTGTIGEVLINGIRVHDESTVWSGTVNNAGYAEPAKKNSITVTTSFSAPMFSKITINGVDYTFTDNRDTHTVEVAGASSYVITATADNTIPIPKTIIWTNPDWVAPSQADEEWAREFKIDHGYAKAIEVYDKNNNKLQPSSYINTTVQPDGTRSDEYGLNAGFGWVAIMPGYRVVFEFVPEYGYQLTGITINGQPVTASTTMNRFEFTMPDGSGNIHFAATFTKTDNVVKSGSSKVTGGTVDVKDNLPGGSAQLTVNDVNLTDEKKQEFTNAANGYTVSEFLNISLLNVYYKGKNDSDDVWSNEIEELDDYVTVSIQLEEGINAEDIVIVHNIHDGKDYEVIEIESYDPETRILTFKTRSFSNYAIATKGEVKKTSNPKTGDNIALFASLFMVASIGAIVTLKINKDRKVRK